MNNSLRHADPARADHISGGSHVEQLHQVMTAAFIRWHLTSDFTAAADYTLARRAWEAALLDAIKENGDH